MNVTARHREKREKTYRIKTNNQEELIRKQNESRVKTIRKKKRKRDSL